MGWTRRRLTRNMANSDSITTGSSRLLRLSLADNIAVVTATAEAGCELCAGDGTTIRLRDRLEVGHKVAIREIAAGEKIVKFGCPIGSATRAIRSGEHVHTHNLKSDYLPTFTLDSGGKSVKE